MRTWPHATTRLSPHASTKASEVIAQRSEAVKKEVEISDE
jgi:hypothetical protein